MRRRTRLGKVVGSYRQPLDAWTYWPQGSKWYLVAPSGARIRTYDTEQEAKDAAARENDNEQRP